MAYKKTVSAFLYETTDLFHNSYLLVRFVRDLNEIFFFTFKALAKKWDKLNIPMKYDYILERAYVLAHLPANKIIEGGRIITTLIDNVANGNEGVTQKLQIFGSYLRRYWIPLADVVSVYKKSIRTNNTCENFHVYTGKAMGNRSNVFRMLGIYNISDFYYT